MNKYTVIQTIRFSEKQAESLQKLKDYDVNVSQFIRIAIAEKIILVIAYHIGKKKKSGQKSRFETIVKNNTYGAVW